MNLQVSSLLLILRKLKNFENNAVYVKCSKTVSNVKTVEKHEGSIGLFILIVQHKLQDLQTLHQSLSTHLMI